MENYQISGAQISASSHFGSHAPTYGRLHFKGGAGAWAAGANDLNQWFQIDLRVEANVTFVATQGRHKDNKQWVTQYKLQYSKDGLSFQFYKETRWSSDKVRTLFANRCRLILVICPNKSRNADRQAINQCWNLSKGSG